MAKHVHIHLHRAAGRDAGTAHDPSNGQFTSGSGGGAAPKKLGGHESMASTHAKRANALRAEGVSGNPAKSKLMVQHQAAYKAHKAAAEAEKTKHPDYERLAAAAHGATRMTQR